MQFPSDTALAAAIASDDRSLAIQLLVDWGGTGLYDHAYSDLSTVTEEVNVERDLSGDVPDEVNLVEGHQAAKVTVKLAGTRAGDALSIGEILSPYRTDSPRYGLLDLGLRVKYSIIVGTSEGPKVIRQFTGRIRSLDIDVQGKVTMLAQDHSELLRMAVSLRPWAMDATRRYEDLPDHVQQIYPQWVLDHILRQCRIYQSPPLVNLVGDQQSVAVFSATLHGGWNAEVGDTLQFERAVDVRTTPMWTPGQFGLAANANSQHYSSFEYFTPFAVPWPEGWSVACGCWLYCPQAIADDPSFASGYADLIFLWMNNDDVKYFFQVNASGQLRLNLQDVSSGYAVTFTGPTVGGSAAWHYVGVSARRNAGSGMVATFTIDGTNTVVNSGTVFPQFDAVTIQQNLVRVKGAMPLQCVQAWVIPATTLTWPKDLITSANDLTPGSVLDTGTNGMTRIPDLFRVDAWDTLRDIAGAEFGLLWVDEFGTVRFADRATVRTVAATDDRVITLDHLTGFAIHDIADGVRNKITWSAVQGVTHQAVSVFRAQRAEDFDVPPNSTITFPVSVKDAQYVGRKSMLIVNPWPEADDWVQAGWYVFERGTANPAPGVEVSTYPIDQRTIAVQVLNPNSFWIRFVGNQNQPAMRIDGRQVTEELPRVGSVQHDGSISAYAERVWELPSSPWISYYSSAQALAQSLLKDTHTSIPTIDRIPCIGDPRTQLKDSALIDTARFGRMLGVVQGISRTLSTRGGLTEDLTIRLIHPGGSWVLGDPVMSELGTTTVLS